MLEKSSSIVEMSSILLSLPFFFEGNSVLEIWEQGSKNECFCFFSIGTKNKSSVGRVLIVLHMSRLKMKLSVWLSIWWPGEVARSCDILSSCRLTNQNVHATLLEGQSVVIFSSQYYSYMYPCLTAVTILQISTCWHLLCERVVANATPTYMFPCFTSAKILQISTKDYFIKNLLFFNSL